MSAIAAEAFLAAGYSTFLLLCAGVLDLLARHSARRSEAYRTAGFTFHHHLDLWECPEGARGFRGRRRHQGPDERRASPHGAPAVRAA